MKQLKKISLLVTAFLLISQLSVNAQSLAKMQSVYIYNFTKLVAWPDKSGDFVIGVLGGGDIVGALKALAKAKKAGSQTIVVKEYGSVGEIGKCNILVVSKGDVAAAAGKVGGNATLIISDEAGGTDKGAAINFVLVDNKQKFELKKANATSKGLKVSSSLEKLAIIK